MDEYPSWLFDYMRSEGYTCRNCSNPFLKRGLVACGIKNSEADPRKYVLFITYLCPKCKKKYTLELTEMTFQELCMRSMDSFEDDAMIEKLLAEELKKVRFTRKKTLKAKKKVKKTKITEAENESAIDMIKQSLNWDDWLLSIGYQDENKEQTFEIVEDIKDEDVKNQ